MVNRLNSTDKCTQGASKGCPGGMTTTKSQCVFQYKKGAANRLAHIVLLVRGLSFYLFLPPPPLSFYHLQSHNTSSNHSHCVERSI